MTTREKGELRIFKKISELSRKEDFWGRFDPDDDYFYTIWVDGLKVHLRWCMEYRDGMLVDIIYYSQEITNIGGEILIGA